MAHSTGLPAWDISQENINTDEAVSEHRATLIQMSHVIAYYAKRGDYINVLSITKRFNEMARLAFKVLRESMTQGT